MLETGTHAAIKGARTAIVVPNWQRWDNSSTSRSQDQSRRNVQSSKAERLGYSLDGKCDQVDIGLRTKAPRLDTILGLDEAADPQQRTSIQPGRPQLRWVVGLEVGDLAICDGDVGLALTLVDRESAVELSELPIPLWGACGHGSAVNTVLSICYYNN